MEIRKTDRIQKDPQRNYHQLLKTDNVTTFDMENPDYPDQWGDLLVDGKLRTFPEEQKKMS